MKENKSENTLFEIASSQGGYFTAWQAVQAGYIETNHPYHIKKGNWIRELRGIYRLSRYPLNDDDQYYLWSVWSMNRKGEIQGVYSHETALNLYGLTDIMPEKLHMTVPRSFRRHSKIPNILHLHFGNNISSDIEMIQGYQVTNPFKTIIDLIRVRTTSPELLHQAITQSIDKGYITHKKVSELKKMPRIGFKIKEILGE